MMQEEKPYRIYLSPPFQSGSELEFLKKALDSNWLAPGGAQVKEFEQQISHLTKRRFGIALNSGTAALHLALIAIGVQPGDYVICQTFSFVATANPIAYLHAKPIFIDSEEATWNIDPDLLEAAIIDLDKNGIRPKAIVYAHIYGNPAKTRELIDISRKYQIPLVEDAAEALGSLTQGDHVGAFADVSIFSFNGNKMITSSGGGMLLTDNEELANRAISLSVQSRNRMEPHRPRSVGYNYRMSNVSAALGLAQLTQLDLRVQKKRDIFDDYAKALMQLGNYEFFLENGEVKSNRWLSVFLAPDAEHRDRIIDLLEKNQIECRRIWYPLHLLNIYANQAAYHYNVALNLFNRGFCLPSGVGLTNFEQCEIIGLIQQLH
jgi:dTDP-4-amino-4,6-dideoxygalactose transaminase